MKPKFLIFGKHTESMKIPSRSRLSLILLFMCVFHIFIIGLIPGLNTEDLFYSISITIIFLLSFWTVADNNKLKLSFPGIAILVLWAAELLELPILMKLASIVTFIFFFYIIIRLMKKVVESAEVTLLEFAESINAYLLFGIAGSLIFNAIYHDFPGAYNMPDNTHYGMANFVYYTFVTLSTLGYGDITPVSPFARSMSIFFSVAGQLYMGMIVAVLVGKYLSKKTR